MRTLNEILIKPCSAKELLLKKRNEEKSAFDAKKETLFEYAKSAGYKEKAIKAADEYMEGLFVLPGTEGKPFFVGNPPRWNEKPVSDEEYTYSLNRLYEIEPLCKAYLLTGEEKYAKKAVSDVISWINDCPRPSMCQSDSDLVKTFQGLTPWRLLECGIRMLESWNSFYELLLPTDAISAETFELYLRSVYEHAELISRVSPLAWPDGAHNHYLNEMCGLLVISCRFPEFDRAEEWKKQSSRELFRSIKAQITFDGAQIEACANYHNICLDMIAKALKIVRDYKIEIPDEITKLVASAYDHSAWTLMPTGYMCTVGDSYALPKYIPPLVDAYFKEHKNAGALEKILPLINRYDCPGTPDWIFAEAEAKSKSIKGGVRHFSSIGQIIGRTGWTKDDSYFLLNCRSPVFNGHAQQDPMSFSLCLNGKDVVVDPSYLTYDEVEDRRIFKSIKYHSSLTFGDKEPYEYLSRWDFTEQKPGHTVMAYEGNGLLGADAYHENYAPCEHRRLCALIEKDIFIVCDDVYSPTGDEVKIRLHLNDTDYTLTDSGAENASFQIILPSGKSELTAARKSIFTDIALPSSILCLTPKAQGEREIYLTAISANCAIKSMSAKRCDEKIAVTVNLESETKTLIWQFGKSCELI